MKKRRESIAEAQIKQKLWKSFKLAGCVKRRENLTLGLMLWVYSDLLVTLDLSFVVWEGRYKISHYKP